MIVSTTPTLLEPDDLLRMPDGDHYELIDGVLREKPTGAEADEISLHLGMLLSVFVRANRLGRVYGSSTGYRCFPDRPKTVRKPDASFVAADRLPNGQSPKGDFLIAPDLAAEVISPGDKHDEVETKVAEYRAAGVKLIWVVSPISRTVLIRRLDGTGTEVGETGELSGEDVIPGFACKVADLFV
jgi:Uma2 family endonuclease